MDGKERGGEGGREERWKDEKKERWMEGWEGGRKEG